MKTKPMLTAVEIDQILSAARAEAEARGLAVSVGIVDDGGYPLRLVRLEGAGLLTAQVAVDKARTAALLRAPSRVLAERVKTEPALLRLTDYLPLEGGLPIVMDGVCVGGIGVSGGKPDDDEAVGNAGLATLQ